MLRLNLLTLVLITKHGEAAGDYDEGAVALMYYRLRHSLLRMT